MALPTTVRVKSCMGCIPLQEGTIILGYLGLFGSVLEIFRYILIMVNQELHAERCEEDKLVPQPTLPNVLLENVTVNDEDLKDDQPDMSTCPSEHMILAVRFIMVVKSGSFFILFILTSLMIHGAKMGKPKLIVPWLWWQLATITLAILGLFGTRRAFDDFVNDIITIIMLTYIFIVVNSYYQKLREEGAGSADVTVVALSHPSEEMTVTIPSPRKDDPPPPYPSFTSGNNPAYNPTDSTGFPYVPAPQYTSSQNYPGPPPPYHAAVYINQNRSPEPYQ